MHKFNSKSLPLTTARARTTMVTMMLEMFQVVAVIMEVGTVRRILFTKGSINFDPSASRKLLAHEMQVEHMEGIFEVVGCSKQQKAVLASF